MSDRSTAPGGRALGSIAVLLGIVVIVGGLIWWGVTVNQGESKYGSFDLPGRPLWICPPGKWI